MERLCILPKDVFVMANEKDVEQLWSLLESIPEIMDELCVAGKTEVENQKAVVKEAQPIELEIGAMIKKALKVVISHVN